MKKFLKQLSIFMIIISVILEITIRILRLTPEIPQRKIDDNGIQTYIKNQNGFFSSESKEKWEVNEFGWVGVSDNSSTTVYSIIGDSFIENFHNPLSCHQATYLKKQFPKLSFFEAARSGMSFIENLETTKYLDSIITPEKHLIYLNSYDLDESIFEIKKLDDRMQFSINSNQIIKGKIKNKILKKFLYNIKIIHFFYLNYPKRSSVKNIERTKNINFNGSDSMEIFHRQLLKFSLNNYNTEKMIFIFHPNVEEYYINLFSDFNFEVFKLKTADYQSWKFDNDPHWNCFGHNQAAIQVGNHIKNNHIKPLN